MLLPLSAGMVLTQNERDLEGAFAQQAPYLFKGSGASRNVDQGVRSFQCSRRADVLNAVSLPQAVGSPESRKAALGRHAGTGQDDDILDCTALHKPDLMPLDTQLKLLVRLRPE